MEPEDAFASLMSPPAESPVSASRESFDETALLESLLRANSYEASSPQTGMWPSPSPQPPTTPLSEQSNGGLLYFTGEQAPEAPMAQKARPPTPRKGILKKTPTKKGSAQEGLAKQFATNQATQKPTPRKGQLRDAKEVLAEQSTQRKRKRAASKVSSTSSSIQDELWFASQDQTPAPTSATKHAIGTKKPKPANLKATPGTENLTCAELYPDSNSPRKKRMIESMLQDGVPEETIAALIEQENAEARRKQMRVLGVDMPNENELGTVDLPTSALAIPATPPPNTPKKVNFSTPLLQNGTMRPPASPSPLAFYTPQSQQKVTSSVNSPLLYKTPQPNQALAGLPNALSPSMFKIGSPMNAGGIGGLKSPGLLNTGPFMNQTWTGGLSPSPLLDTQQLNYGSDALLGTPVTDTQQSLHETAESTHPTLTPDPKGNVMLPTITQSPKEQKAIHMILNLIPVYCQKTIRFPPAKQAVTSAWLDMVAHSMWDAASWHNGLLDMACMFASCWPHSKLRALAGLGLIPSWWWMREGLVFEVINKGKRVDDGVMARKWMERERKCEVMREKYRKEKEEPKEKNIEVRQDADVDATEADARVEDGGKAVDQPADIAEEVAEHEAGATTDDGQNLASEALEATT